MGGWGVGQGGMGTVFIALDGHFWYVEVAESECCSLSDLDHRLGPLDTGVSLLVYESGYGIEWIPLGGLK